MDFLYEIKLLYSTLMSTKLGMRKYNNDLLDYFRGRTVKEWLFLPIRVVILGPLVLLHKVLEFSSGVVEATHEYLNELLS